MNSSNDTIINDTVDILETTGIVPVDRILALTELGIDYRLLEEKHSILN
jgi:hypothetical protein